MLCVLQEVKLYYEQYQQMKEQQQREEAEAEAEQEAAASNSLCFYDDPHQTSHCTSILHHSRPIVHVVFGMK